MSEHGNCYEAERAKPLPVETSKSPKSSPIQATDGRKGDYSVNCDSPAEEGCPKVEPCPGAKAILGGDAIEKGNGDKNALEKAKNAPPGPLGPVPFKPGENVPLDYWTPLGSMTGTRPAVENFSLSRFSPSEWREHNEKVSRACCEGIEVAAIAGYNARCSVLKAYAGADRNQVDNNLRLSTRAGLIYRWKNELEKILEIIIEEIDLLQEAKRRTMRAKSVLQLVENIGKDIMHTRCFRVDRDLVRDRVSEEVIKVQMRTTINKLQFFGLLSISRTNSHRNITEILYPMPSKQELSLCEEMRDVYARLLDQIKMQIEELRTAKQRLEFDWSNKSEAYEIDVTARGLNSESNTILWKSGCVRLPPDQSSPSSYEYSTNQIITEGTTAKQRSSTLRANVVIIIEKAVHDLRDQADRTCLALMEQIQLQEQALRRLEAELFKNLQQSADIESLVDEMHDTTKKLDGTMKCAQTRLSERLLRPGDENCRDVPQFGLIEEVKSLSENVTATLGQMKRTDDSTIALTETRRNIERELMIKRKSLYIDKERCQLLRTFYPSAKALAAN